MKERTRTSPCDEEEEEPLHNKDGRKFRRVLGAWIASLQPSSTLPLFVVVFCLYFGYAQAVAECMSGNNLKCFECNSHENALCRDPFNWTTLPPLKQCDGCCVKMVQGIGTPQSKIIRTCITEMQINMFMVDHVCMSQSNRKGTLCFCEDDMCNRATTDAAGSSSLLLIVLVSLASLVLKTVFSRLGSL